MSNPPVTHLPRLIYQRFIHCQYSYSNISTQNSPIYTSSYCYPLVLIHSFFTHQQYSPLGTHAFGTYSSHLIPICPVFTHQYSVLWFTSPSTNRPELTHRPTFYSSASDSLCSTHPLILTLVLSSLNLLIRWYSFLHQHWATMSSPITTHPSYTYPWVTTSRYTPTYYLLNITYPPTRLYPHNTHYQVFSTRPGHIHWELPTCKNLLTMSSQWMKSIQDLRRRRRRVHGQGKPSVEDDMDASQAQMIRCYM